MVSNGKKKKKLEKLEEGGLQDYWPGVRERRTVRMSPGKTGKEIKSLILGAS